MFQLNVTGVRPTGLCGKKFIMKQLSIVSLGSPISPSWMQDSQRQEKHRDDVDRHAEFSETPSSRQKWLVPNTLDDDAADGDDVRDKEGTGSERGDSVECYRASQVDQCEQHREYVGGNDRVQRDIPPRADVSQPSRKWRALGLWTVRSVSDSLHRRTFADL